jgi:hypothetical protein
MDISPFLARLQAHINAHEALVIALEDFTNSALNPKAQERLTTAYKASRALIWNNPPLT